MEYCRPSLQYACFQTPFFGFSALSSIVTTAAPPSLPEPALLQGRLRAALPGFRHVDWVERTGSTNADLLQLARCDEQPARPWLLGAHLQENGRGRAGRTWQNRPGANLMFSCAFDVFLPARSLAALSPLAGVAACEALRDLLEPHNRTLLSLKWPNDLQWRFSKLAGILVEVTRSGTIRHSADHHVVIIGLGVNLLDARALSTSLNRGVADWAEITADDERARGVEIADMVVGIANAWKEALAGVVREGFEDFPARYAEVDHLLGQHLAVLNQGSTIQAGVACGVNEQGQLLIRTPAGIETVSVGEVSVRPLPEDRIQAIQKQ